MNYTDHKVSDHFPDVKKMVWNVPINITLENTAKQ
jgi:hypothetical protein